MSITIVIDKIRTAEPEHFGVLSGWQWYYLKEKMLRAGIQPSECKVKLLSDYLDPQEATGLILEIGRAHV